MEKPQKNAWTRQREFKKANIVSITPEKMLQITKAIDNLTLRSLVALLYITGCRISELVRYEKLWFEKEEYIDEITGKKRKRVLWKTRKVIERLPSIKRNQLRYESRGEDLFLVITVRNLKNRKNHEKTIPFAVARPINQEFLKIIDAYTETIESDDEMFPYTRPQIEYRLKKELPFNIHYIRDIRATHLYVLCNLKEEELKRNMGWSDLRMADRYVALRWEDFAYKT
jgi:integrase